MRLISFGIGPHIVGARSGATRHRENRDGCDYVYFTEKINLNSQSKIAPPETLPVVRRMYTIEPMYSGSETFVTDSVSRLYRLTRIIYQIGPIDNEMNSLDDI